MLAGKPRLLFLSPVVPRDDGNGLAMRGAVFLRALAPLYDVVLHVIPVFGPVGDPSRSPCVAETCVDAVVHAVVGREDPLFRMVAAIRNPDHRFAALAGYPRPRPCRFATEAAIAEVRSRYAGTAFHSLHVFRLYLAPFAAPFLDDRVGEAPASCRLDLDDDEARTARRLAGLYDLNGDAARAHLERAEAAKYARLGGRYLPRFDAVYTAGGADRDALARRFPRGTFLRVPNAVRVPEAARPAGRDGPFTLLFVGTMGYYPNEDAVLFFCREVLPLLRERAGREVRLVVAGTGPSPAVRALAEPPGVAVTGALPDLAPLYGAADAVIAPLRAGGGTRIKVLEAFAHRRPVVATTVGAEGLGAGHERHLLIADTPADFAAACRRLMASPALGAALTARALELVRSTYGLDEVMALIRGFAAPR